MKKTLATILALVMAVSCMSTLFVSARDAESLTVCFTQPEGSRVEDCSLTLFRAGDDDLELKSGDLSMRWTFEMVVDASDTIVRLGMNLLSEEQDRDNEFEHHGIFVPAGGFCVVIHCGDGENTSANEELRAYFFDLLEAAGYKDSDCQNTVLDVSAAGWQIADLTTEGGEYGYGSVTFYKGKAPAEGPEEPEDPKEPEPVLSYEEEIAAAVGGVLEDPDFAIDLFPSIEVTDGKPVMTVTLTVKDIKEGVTPQALFASLYYDVERLVLLTQMEQDPADGAWTLGCVTTLPGISWYSQTVEREEGQIEINFIGANPYHILTADTPLVLTFSFALKEGYTQAGMFIPTESVSSIYAPPDSPYITDYYYGNGVYAVANYVPTDDPSDPGKDDPSDPGKDDPSDPGKDDPSDPGKDDPSDPGKDDPSDPGTDDPAPALGKGDLGGDGSIDATDYMLLKRYCLGTFKLTEEQLAAADVNGDGEVNALDYMLVKRHVLGTYKIA